MEFYENALGFKRNDLLRGKLMCPQLFDDPSLLRNVDPAGVLTTRGA